MNTLASGWLLAQVEKAAEVERAGVVRQLDIQFYHHQFPALIPIRRDTQAKLPKSPSNRIWRMLGEKD